MPVAAIHYQRPGKPLTVYTEDLVSDNGLRLRTFKTLPPEISERLSLAMQKDGLIESQNRVLTIAKVYFYNENFNLLEFRALNGDLLGYYSDIGTPITRTPDGYTMTDWFLDLWLAPDGTVLELDWDEFEAARAAGLLTESEAAIARATLERLKTEIGAGLYPSQYLAAQE